LLLLSPAQRKANSRSKVNALGEGSAQELWRQCYGLGLIGASLSLLVERNLTQSSRALNTGLRASPLRVSPYSTFGGTCGCIVRRTIPSRSSPRSCWISIFCEILGMALSNSESRRMEFAHKREIIIIFHLPSKHARAFSISLAHMSCCLLLKFLFRDATGISPSLCLALWKVHAYLKTY
jgi:hypothetical protein